MINLLSDFMVPLGAFIAVIVLVPLSICLARKVGFEDHPGERKSHDAPVPPVGGLVVFPVFMAFSCIFLDLQKEDYVFFCGLCVLMLMGGYDDLKPIGAWTKFFMQIGAASFVVLLGDTQVHYLGNLFGLGAIGLGPFSPFFSITAVVLLINAVNLLDGLDGLSGGVCFIVLLCLSYTIRFTDPAMLVLLGALAGFLVYNARIWPRKKASIFIGDAGSLALGLSIAWFGVNYAGYKGAPVHPMTLAWILAFPIYDTCGQFGRRMKNGKHPFSPDHHHFHHQLVKAGFSVVASVGIIWGIVLASSLFGVFASGFGVPLPVITAIWIVGILTHIYMCFEPHRYENLFQRFFIRPKTGS